jgi:hypothetical protein
VALKNILYFCIPHGKQGGGVGCKTLGWGGEVQTLSPHCVARVAAAVNRSIDPYTQASKTQSPSRTKGAGNEHPNSTSLFSSLGFCPTPPTSYNALPTTRPKGVKAIICYSILFIRLYVLCYIILKAL